MWIGAFAEEAGLPVATVRFYVRQGLLKPGHGTHGGSRPYLVFTPRDLRTVASIRMGQAMGLSLADIKALVDERRRGGRTQMLRTMTAQRDTLRQRAAELKAMIRFIDDKIRWLTDGGKGPPPQPPDGRPSRPSARP